MLEQLSENSIRDIQDKYSADSRKIWESGKSRAVKLEEARAMTSVYVLIVREAEKYRTERIVKMVEEAINEGVIYAKDILKELKKEREK